MKRENEGILFLTRGAGDRPAWNISGKGFCQVKLANFCTVKKFKIKAGGHKIPVLVLRPLEPVKDVPGVMWIHGGGYMTGMKEMVLVSRAADLVRRFGAVVVSPGYTRSVHKPYPAAVNDCYEVLRWMKSQSGELGFRDDQIMVGGESAGGGLCAAVCMMARDREEVRVAFQMPLYPMLDSNDTESSRDNHGKVWDTKRNHFGWRLYLRDNPDGEVGPYASPSRQTDYHGLPPCYTFVGNGEPFYSETVLYVEKLKAAGVEASVDVFPSDVHAFDVWMPGSEIAKQAVESFCGKFAYAKEHYFAPQENVRERGHLNDPERAGNGGSILD